MIWIAFGIAIICGLGLIFNRAIEETARSDDWAGGYLRAMDQMPKRRLLPLGILPPKFPT
jgi:hypothetical protein